MTSTTKTPFTLQDSYAEHLPEYAALKAYSGRWLCFGTLTCAKTTAEKTQLEYFGLLMDALGALNGCIGQRLHWVVRVEGGMSSLRHLHFLLGAHKVADGHRCQTNASKAAHFIEAGWMHGISEVTPYDDSHDGLGYVLKAHTDSSREDPCQFSEALFKHLKKQVA